MILSRVGCVWSDVHLNSAVLAFESTTVDGLLTILIILARWEFSDNHLSLYFGIKSTFFYQNMSASELGVGSRIGHPKFGTGVIVSVDETYYKIYFSSLEEVKTLARDYEGFAVVEAKVPDFPMLTMKDVERAIREALIATSERAPLIPLGGKWMGGTLIIEPSDKSLQPKEIPVETFFHKIVMVREKLRVLEQNINNHPKLDDEDRVNMQQYITRCYGSLTTFNVLFAYKEDQFKGSGKD